MNILVTGGLGYIGSHTLIRLIELKHNIIVVDNLSNSKASVIERIKSLSGGDFIFYNCDICNAKCLQEIFSKHNINKVIHFAGLKSVSESGKAPLTYYHNNVVGTLNLLKVMYSNGIKDIIFSSSATVYGMPDIIPLTEKCVTGGTTNPYGTSKHMVEQILMDLIKSDGDWNITILRYFNPIGAHPSGEIGEDPQGIPNNLVPYVTKVAIGDLPFLTIYGDDYSTPDGTGIRDYIHVCDLAEGHIAALNNKEISGLHIYNLGTGVGSSVLDIINTFEQVNHVSIPYRISKRREGDVAQCWADPTLIQTKLNWRAKYNLEDMLKHAWLWQLKNKGYV
ncbi:TPA: UDP-glucose 4-epimerase GalE [Escherichia coli]|nr:UDP-glucose 4-epimerase GalE [Escherichia coli]EHS5616030.1 UDP-glucose 4-epimerase GalE [Escherichia coli]HAO0324673.1 UDP-glucose 4-epimerase GalE [Escherichia coli]HAO0338106.1 UDP-glucose 4-epimerase GalE [Escherichia coli]HBC0974563.1 UDP-glucose 4-epimerase GalE [Escherichia coli]